MGVSAQSRADFTVAVGAYASASAGSAIAIGKFASGSATNSIAIGLLASSSLIDSITLGNQNVVKINDITASSGGHVIIPTPVGGVYLYSVTGSLYVKNAAGTQTKLSA